MLADLARAFDDAGNEVDPILGEVVALAPFGVAIDAVSVLQGDRIDAQLVERRTAGIGVGWNDIEPVDQAGIDLRVKLLPEVSRERRTRSKTVRCISDTSWTGAICAASASRWT